MFDSFNGTQILLSIMIVLLGVTLVIIGIQLFFVLKDLRKSLAKTDRILSDVEKISAKVVVQQEDADEILQAVRMVATSLSSTTNSVANVTGRIMGPASVGMAVFQAVTRVMAKQREREKGANGLR
jgi:uncharacterized protein YoxC